MTTLIEFLALSFRGFVISTHYTNATSIMYRQKGRNLYEYHKLPQILLA